MEELIIKGKQAREASRILALASTADKNRVLGRAAERLVGDARKILAANRRDMQNAEKAGLKGAIHG
jgi:glutamate-5-semialdehyde dehydrogenase